MSLTYGLKTAKDLLAKLKRDAALLDEEVSSDRFFNFVITGYSLIDWIRNDPSVPSLAKTATEVNALYANHWLKICGDIATASKHFTLTQRTPVTSQVTTGQGYGVGRYGKGGWGVGEEQIDVVLDGGASVSGLDLVRDVVAAWDQFFLKHGI